MKTEKNIIAAQRRKICNAKQNKRVTNLQKNLQLLQSKPETSKIFRVEATQDGIIEKLLNSYDFFFFLLTSNCYSCGGRLVDILYDELS